MQGRSSVAISQWPSTHLVGDLAPEGHIDQGRGAIRGHQHAIHLVGDLAPEGHIELVRDALCHGDRGDASRLGEPDEPFAPTRMRMRVASLVEELGQLRRLTCRRAIALW